MTVELSPGLARQTAAGQLNPTAPFCSLLGTPTPTDVTRLHGPHLMVLRVLRVRFHTMEGSEYVSTCLILFHAPRPRPILVHVRELPPGVIHGQSCYLP